MADVDPGIEELVENFELQLKVIRSVEGEGEEEEEVQQASDDGYISSGSTENLAPTGDKTEEVQQVEVVKEITEKTEAEKEETREKEDVEKKVKDNDDDDDDDDDDEKILEPLVIIDEKAATVQPGIEFISRGPVSIDQFDHRFQPYGRPPVLETGGHNHQQQQQLQPHLELLGDEESYVPPRPILLVYTKKDRENPTRLDNAPIEWSDKHELCIAKFPLPDDTVFDGASCSQVGLFPIYLHYCTVN